jgi:two-component system phosphate regulon sensor histidine kinase PhoR
VVAEAPLILVVDDERGIREGCRKVLASEGYVVETAADGAQGLALLRGGGRFAAALVDLKMPQVNGLDFIAAARKHNADLEILVITAYASIESAIAATRGGAYGYLSKPFAPDELVMDVRNALRHRALVLEARRARQEREDSLLEMAFERSKSRTIIDCMADGVLVVNREGRIVLRNGAVGRMLPSWAEMTLPAPLANATGCDDLAALVRHALGVPDPPWTASCELTVGDKTYMATVSAVVSPEAGPLGAVAILRDITPLRTVEAAKSMFVSMVVHEVKRPLAAVEGYIQAILEGPEDDLRGRTRMLERSLLRLRSLRELVSELMTLTTMDAGGFRLERRLLEVGPCLEEAVLAAREKADQQGVALSLDGGHAGPGTVVLADGKAMLLMLGNLIDNAIKYTPRGGHVRVRADVQGRNVILAVADDGIGLAPEDAARVFEQFFRVRSEQTADVAGTGLGLSIVKRLAEMHGGQVTVRSTPARGSEFRLDMPLAGGGQPQV